MTRANAMAYPLPETEDSEHIPGLTKRELFAAMAMQGMLANSDEVWPAMRGGEESVKAADALIAALNGETKC